LYSTEVLCEFAADRSAAWIFYASTTSKKEASKYSPLSFIIVHIAGRNISHVELLLLSIVIKASIKQDSELHGVFMLHVVATNNMNTPKRDIPASHHNYEEGS
jgi:hypothetical protein